MLAQAIKAWKRVIDSEKAGEMTPKRWPIGRRVSGQNKATEGNDSNQNRSSKHKKDPRNRLISGVFPICHSRLLQVAWRRLTAHDAPWHSGNDFRWLARIGVRSLPLDGCRRLGGHVEDDAVDLGHRVGDARGDAGQDVVG